MKGYIKKLLREGLITESYEMVPYDYDVDLSDYDIDENEAYDKVHQIAKDGGVRILNDKDLNGILIDTNNNIVIGGLWVSSNPETFSFDIAIDSGYHNMGLSNQLIKAAIDVFKEQKDAYDDLKMEVSVINPKLASILANKYGFHKIPDMGQNEVLMGLKENFEEPSDWTNTSWEDNGIKITIEDVINHIGNETRIELVSSLVSKLSSRLNRLELDDDRVMNADLKHPIILVFRDGEYEYILDGNHRLAKAIKEKVKTIKVKVLNLDSPNTPEKFKELL